MLNIFMPPQAQSDSAEKESSNYETRALETLDSLVQDWNEEGYEKAKLSAPDLSEESNINYQTWHKNGVHRKIKKRVEAVSYEKWGGFVIEIEDYVAERGLAEND